MHGVLYLCKKRCLQSFLEEVISARAMCSCLLVEQQGVKIGHCLLLSAVSRSTPGEPQRANLGL
jgi:hypothetical protein